MYLLKDIVKKVLSIDVRIINSSGGTGSLNDKRCGIVSESYIKFLLEEDPNESIDRFLNPFDEKYKNIDGTFNGRNYDVKCREISNGSIKNWFGLGNKPPTPGVFYLCVNCIHDKILKDIECRLSGYFVANIDDPRVFKRFGSWYIDDNDLLKFPDDIKDIFK